MNLKKIEVYGFKSFSDKLSMRFDFPVTGVVGPNGCGKSNVVDVVRWVLGEQSAKALRGKTMQDLIFSGTEQRKSMSYCEAALFLDNKERIFSIDMDEVVISRKLYRNNESEYYINKNLARLKDVTDLLRDAGLGREGYAIVGQGRMDSVLNARPEDRRAIFEEALGISRFRARKVETERKIEKTRENMSSLYIILTELEKRVGPLKKQAADAVKYLQLAEQLKYHEINTYIYTYDNASERKEKLKQAIAELEENIERISGKYTEARAKYQELYAQMNNADAVMKAYRDKQLELSVEIERKAGESKLLRERARYLENANAEYQKQIADAESLTARMKKNIEETNTLQEAKRGEHESIAKSLAEMTENAVGFSDRLIALQDRVEQAQKQVVDILNKLSAQKSLSSALISEKNTLSARLERVNRDIEEVNGKIRRLSDEQSRDIDGLIEGNYAAVSADKLAADVEGYAAAIKNLLPRVVLSDETQSKVLGLLDTVGRRALTELRQAKNFEHQNWQQNLILMSALKERFGKYAALHDAERHTMSRLVAEKAQLENRLGEIEFSLQDIAGKIEELNEKREEAGKYSAENQKQYNEIKTQKDKAQEEITSTKLKMANLMSNITAGENLLNGYRQTVNRASSEITQKTAQIGRNKETLEALIAQIESAGDEKPDSGLLEEIKRKLSETDKIKSGLQEAYAEADREMQGHSAELAKHNEWKTREEFNLLRIDDDLAALQQKILDDYGHTYSSAMQLKDDNYDAEKTKEEVSRIRAQIGKFGFINPNAVAEYDETLSRYNDINAQIDDLKKAEADLLNALKEVTREIIVRFNDGFEIISHNFGLVFKELFAGGHARMTIDREEGRDELDYGVEIEAQPPGKRLQNISLLSGGERTLTAAAILFAILKLRPMPFCVLDEIEAALDDANAQRIAQYLKKFSGETQFLVVTHKKPTMEACDVLYGVTMEEKGVSKIVSVQLTDAIKDAV